MARKESDIDTSEERYWRHMKRIEFWLLAAVAVVSAYHVVVRFSDADHMGIAIVQGVALSALLAYFAHAVATRPGWQKLPALVGLLVFAAFSATFQTLHFLHHGTGLWEAVARGCWAPVAEVLLGALLVSSDTVQVNSRRGQSGGLRMFRALDNLATAALDSRTAQLQTVHSEQPDTVQTTVTAGAPAPEVDTVQRTDSNDDLLHELRTLVKQQLSTQGKLNKSQLAKELDISRTTVYRLLDQLPEPVVHTNGVAK